MSSPPIETFSNGFISIVRECHRLLQAWWNVDRIRASPVEGELLQVPLASFLQIDGKNWRVEARWVCEDRIGPFVRYQCSDGRETARLEVRPSPPVGTGVIRWINGDESRELHPVEIEVYAIDS